jgi:LuxR family quorum sensing-dependent transcriptional regulator
MIGAAQMSVQSDEYGKRALDFVQRLQKLTEYEDICRHIEQELAWFGFSCVTSFAMPGPGEHAASGLMMNNRPPEYIARYVEKNYIVHDPAVTELRHTLDPYSWSDIRNRRPLKKGEKAIIDEASEFGSREGFIIPIVKLSGSAALFCPCGEEPDLTDRARAALEVIGIYTQRPSPATSRTPNRSSTHFAGPMRSCKRSASAKSRSDLPKI